MEGSRIAKGPGSIGTGLIGGHEPSLGRGSRDSRQKQERLFTCRRAAGRKTKLETQQKAGFCEERHGSDAESEITPTSHHHCHHHCPHHWHCHCYCGFYLVNTMSRHFLCFILFKSDKKKLSAFYYSYFIEEKSKAGTRKMNYLQ